MVISKRERYIVIGALVAVGLLAADQFAISPLFEEMAATQAQQSRLSAEWSRAQKLLDHRRKLAPQWKQKLDSGMKSDATEAEAQIFHAFRGWAEESGVVMGMLLAERLSGKSRLPQIDFQATGTGGMNGIARLLYRMQGAVMPLKLTEVQINARKEGTDDLAFTLRFSTLYLPQRPTAASTPVEAAEGVQE